MKFISFSRLLAQADAIEQRMFDTTHFIDQLNDDSRLQQIIIDACGPHSGLDFGKPLSQQMPSVWRAISGETNLNPPNGRISLRDLTVVYASDQLLRYLETSADLDLRAIQVVRCLQPSLARILATDYRDLIRRDHPFNRFFERLIVTFRCFDRYSGASAEILVKRIGEIVETVSTSSQSPRKAFEEGEKKLSAQLRDFSKKTSELAKITVAKNLWFMQVHEAKAMVNRELHKITDGKHLPLMLLEFLQKVWNKYLYITYLKHGGSSNIWAQSIFDTSVLVRGLAKKELDNAFPTTTNELIRAYSRIKTRSIVIHAEKDLAARFFAAMERFVTQAPQDKISEFNETFLVEPDESPHLPPTEVFGPEEPPLIAGLRVGSWYKLKEHGLEKRCKLVQKNSQYGYCIFVNFSGVRTAKCYSHTLISHIRNDRLLRIDDSPVLKNALASACQMTADILLPKLESKATEFDQEREKYQARKISTDLRVHLNKLEQERLLEKIWKLEEKLKNLQTRSYKQAVVRMEIEQQAQEQVLQRILADIEQVQSGASLELIDDQGTHLTCKLGLKIKFSGKIVLVDNLGRLLKEMMPRELAERIMEGSATILDFGIDFENTLETMIVNRSERIEVADAAALLQ